MSHAQHRLQWAGIAATAIKMDVRWPTRQDVRHLCNRPHFTVLLQATASPYTQAGRQHRTASTALSYLMDVVRVGQLALQLHRSDWLAQAQEEGSSQVLTGTTRHSDRL